MINAGMLTLHSDATTCQNEHRRFSSHSKRTNGMVSKTVTKEDRPRIRSAIGADNQIFAAAAARIYTARSGEKRWRVNKPAGALILYQRHDTGILYFALVDLSSAKLPSVTWSQEVYVDFKYFRDTDTFQSFEGDEAMTGFLFASAQDAAIFHDVVAEQLATTVGATHDSSPEKTFKKSRSLFNVFRFGSSKKQSTANDGSDTDSIRSVDSGSSSHKANSKDSAKKDRKKSNDDLTHDDVSEPRDFRHLSHIGFNPEKGSFDIKNIPDDWKRLFAKAGITHDQLENRETANFIAGFVDQTGTALPKKKPAPPPPSKLKSTAAPSRGNAQFPSESTSSPVKKTAPPPPPKKKSVPSPTKSAQQTQSIDPGRSSLLASIRASGTKVLKPVERNEAEDRPASVSAADPRASLMASAADPRASLMASIRGAGPLKPASAPVTSPSSSTASAASGDPTDMMAAMLAKALAARNKKLAADSDDSDASDNDRW